jgi:GT2 family glycosyltransferase
VIPNWNSLQHLRRCLGSLAGDGSVPEVELLVVDNGSADGSVSYLEAEGIPHLALPENTGFAAAVNLGAARTEAGAVLVLNADTVLEPGCLGALVAALDADPGLGGVQPLILQLEEGDPDPPRIYSAGQSLTRDGRGFEDSAGALLGSNPLLPAHSAGESRLGREVGVFGVCGAACLLRRELFDEVGGYDESYFSFCEDVDLNVRARIAGWSFATVPEAVVWHVGNATWQAGFANPGAENSRLVARNRFATQLKFMPASSIPRIAAVEAGALARAAAQRRLAATAAGKLEALRWLPRLRAERRRLAAGGDLSQARAWLGAAPGPRRG